MRDSVGILNAINTRRGWTDYRIAQHFGCTTQHVSGIRHRRRRWSENDAPALAELLGEPVGVVLAELRGERAKRTEIQRAWADVADSIKRAAAGTVAGIGFALAMVADPGMYIMSTRDRTRP